MTSTIADLQPDVSSNQNQTMRNYFLIIIACLAFSCGQNNSSSKESDSQNKDSSQTRSIKPDSTKRSPDTTTTGSTLTISPLETEGNLGQVTFSQKGKTIFYYNLKTKSGKIKLNGTEYVLDKFSFDSNTGSYILSGGGVSVNAPNCKFQESKGEDCGYGDFALVTVVMGGGRLGLEGVGVQDCLEY